MRIMKLVIVILFVTIFGLWWASPARAQCTGCQVCQEPGPCHEDPVTGENICPDIWVTGSGCGQTNGGCPSGAYNTPTGACRAIGTGSRGSGGWVYDEMGGGSCPAGYKADYSQPTRSFCTADYKDTEIREGEARKITGCCNNWKENQDGDTVCGGGNYQWTDYACVPICTASAPLAPTLASPANASSQSSTTASLLWNSVSSWGTACSGANNQYYVYLGTTNPPNYYTTVAGNVTSLNVGSLTRGATYYWQITASNGQLYTSSSVRSFTILNNQIAGTVFYDTANNCGGSGWSTGGVSVSLNGGVGNAVSGTGTFSIAEPLPGPHTLAVSIPAGFICSTAPGCNSCSRLGINLTPAHRLHMSRECLYPRGFV